MPQQMQRLIFSGIVGFLKHGNIICPACMQIAVIRTVHRINFQPHIPEISCRQPAGLSDVRKTAHFMAFACQKKDFFHAGLCNDLHFMFHFFHCELFARDIIITVKSAVHAVILAVICQIQRREQVDRIAKMPARFLLCLCRHFFQMRQCSRGQQRLEIFHAARFPPQCPAHICIGITAVIIALHLSQHFFHNIRRNALHAFQICHMVCPCGRVLLYPVLVCKGFA